MHAVTTPARWRHGHVAWFNTEKGFGFLIPDDGGHAVYVDFQTIEGTGYRALDPGQPVVFTSIDTGRGPETTTVRPYTRTDTGARTR
nr:cold shock domain-containing protein [Nocardia otitidiscaviarum]